MPRYRILMTRDCTESTRVIVDAESLEESEALAAHKADTDKTIKWEYDECSGCGAYCGDLEEASDIIGDEADEYSIDADATCPETGLEHVLDLSTVSVTRDGNGIYVDVNCKDCGRSGCIGAVDMFDTGVDW